MQLYIQVRGPRQRGAVLNLRVLIVKTLLGQIPEVVASLEESLRIRDTQTAASVLFNPEFAPLRAHPSYAALAEKARAVYAEVRLE